MKFLRSSNLFVFLLLAVLSLGNCTNNYGEISIGENCNESLQCVGIPDVTSYCDKLSIPQICSCKLDYVASSLKNDCLNRTQIGYGCTDPAECKGGVGGEFSDCMENEEEVKTCQCSDEAVVIEVGVGYICEKKSASIGDVCYVNEQCTANLGPLSECENETCQCQCVDGAVKSGDNKKCFATGVPIGGRCEVHLECAGQPNSACSNGICVCAAEFISSDNRQECLPIRNDAGQPCKEIQQCQRGQMGSLSNCSGTDPNNKVFQCNPDAISTPGEPLCRPKASHVGDSCEIQAQCLNLNMSQCVGGQCVCNVDTVESSDSTKCLVKSNLNSTCEDENQCSWNTGAVCTEMICRCSPNYIQNGDRCMRKAQFVGENCEIKIQCTENLSNLSICSNGNCTCLSDAIPNANRTRCVASDENDGVHIGSPCETNNQCVGDPGTSQCFSGICVCLPEYIASNNLDDCLQIRNNLGEECKENQQCRQGKLGQLSMCAVTSTQVKVCNCIPAAIAEPADNLCRRKATFVGDTCDVQTQCLAHLGYSRCTGGICSCLENADAFDDLSGCHI